MNTNAHNTTDRNSWLMMLIISTAYIAIFANIQGFKAMLPLVQDEFGITRAQIGLYTSFYFLSTVLISIFSGKITDFLGAKKGLIIGVAVIAGMMALHSISPLFNIILFLAFITGFAFSIITPTVSKAVVELSEPSRRSFFMGIVHGFGGVGGFLGAVLLPYFGVIIGWRTTLLFGSFFAFLVSLFILKFFTLPTREKEKEDKARHVAPPESLGREIKSLLQNRYLLSIFSMGIVLGMSISSVTGHYTIFLTRDLGLETALAGLGLGIFHVGGILGQPAWGFASDRIFRGNRKKVLILLCFLISGLAFFYGLVISRYFFPPYVILFFSFLLGFSIMGIIAIYFTAVSELVPAGKIGFATGVALLFPRTSTVLSPPLYGLIADISGTYALSWLTLGTVVLILVSVFIFTSRKYGHQASAIREVKK